MENMLVLKNVSKSFGGVKALQKVNLELKKGEIHCLAGENGCGKSTLIKIISGFYTPDEGEIEILGEHYSSLTPAESIKNRIQVIYQDFSIFPNLTVAENLSINQIVASGKTWVLPKTKREIAKEACEKIGIDFDLDARLEELPVADKQLVAIARALVADARLIIMDEPTTALTNKEIDRLLKIIFELKDQGRTILFVSHKLNEIFKIADRVTVLRNGKNVVSINKTELTEDSFVHYMTGRYFEKMKAVSNKDNNESPVLSVSNLYADGLEDISLSVKKGQILGITGQLGSGRTELALALFGMLPIKSGNIEFNKKRISIKAPHQVHKMGIALVPEDRLTEGLFLSNSIIDNQTVGVLDQFSSFMGFMKKEQLKKTTDDWIKKIGVVASDSSQDIIALSGGNQQKVLLARWLATEPDVLILNGPTVGVDVGAKYDIHQLLINYAAEGMSIIVVSDDLPELMALCDKIMVMDSGRIEKEFDTEGLTADQLLLQVQTRGRE